jgi:hypothetical protein
MKTKEMPTNKILAIRAKAARQECLTRKLSPLPISVARSTERRASRLPIARLAFTLGTLLLLTAAIGGAAAKAHEASAPLDPVTPHVTTPHVATLGTASTTSIAQVLPR